MREEELPFTGTTQRQRMPHAEIPGCALVQDLIPLYLDGEVTPASHVLMADHLGQCERCSGYLAGARSMRKEILHEQQAVHAATATSQSVAEVRQPVVGSVGATLWRSLMALTWLGGLLLGSVGAAGMVPPLVVIGSVALAFAIYGMRAVEAEQSRLWRALMVVTGLLGACFAPLSVLGLDETHPALLLGGLALVGVAGWGLQRRARGSTASADGAAPRYGATRALLLAGVGIGGGLLCSLLLLLGIVSVLVGHSGGYEPAGGVVMLGVGGTGLMLLTLPFGGPERLMRSRHVRQLSGILLVGGGTTLSALLLLRGLSGSDTLQSVLVLVGAILCATGGFGLLRGRTR